MTDIDKSEEENTEKTEKELERELAREDFNLCVEKDTGLIYEVKYYPNFVLVRPAAPLFFSKLRKLTHIEFGREFNEFYGDVRQVFNFLYGNDDIGIESTPWDGA